MDKEQAKKILKKVWKFIWEDDSIWSWIVNIILAFILIKFLIYPGLGFALGTTHPLVAVVSGSMEHDGSFDDWWASKARCGNSPCLQEEFYDTLGITQEAFKDFSMKNGFNKGDIIVLKGEDPGDLEVGNIIVFQSNRPDPIIHRIVKKWDVNGVYYFQTKGDHNENSYASLSEDEIHEDRIIGKAIIKAPFLGWIKIGAVKLLRLVR